MHQSQTSNFQENKSEEPDFCSSWKLDQLVIISEWEKPEKRDQNETEQEPKNKPENTPKFNKDFSESLSWHLSKGISKNYFDCSS